MDLLLSMSCNKNVLVQLIDKKVSRYDGQKIRREVGCRYGG